MASEGAQPDGSIPAGFTYLGQFVDHDLTQDKTGATLGTQVTVEELLQGRSPALDLDSLYGRGPIGDDIRFYTDGIRLKMGKTAATGFPDARTNVDLDDFDLPRVGVVSGAGSKKSERRQALIPDRRNDENLAVAQVHLAFIRFHNRVVAELAGAGTPSTDLFAAARDLVVRHYQWMLRSDFLPRIVDPAAVDDVFANGRKFFEVARLEDELQRAKYDYMYIQPGDTPTMPIEFSVAAFRLGHSMIRGDYQWNRVFRGGGPGPVASLALLFTFSGTSGILSPDGDLSDPESGSFERLPTNWIADFRRLFDFSEAGRADLTVDAGEFNQAKRLDTLMVDPLRTLPRGSFGGRDDPAPPVEQLNLAFRNLARAQMVELASGQQMAEFLEIPVLSEDQIVDGLDGAMLSAMSTEQLTNVRTDTPLWFYILREAELAGGRLVGVGARIVAEVFHRAMEGSQTSIVRDPGWRPSLGPDQDTFRMSDLLLFAFDGRADLLNPLGDA